MWNLMITTCVWVYLCIAYVTSGAETQEPAGVGMSDPQAAPPAQPLQLLAQMLAEMAKMSHDHAAAQRAHLAALQEQTDRQTLVLERLVGAAAPPKSPPLSVVVPRMGDGDDPQVFLETFCATAEACQWPQVEWAPRLLPLLSGEARTAALSLPPASRGSFQDVSRVVVDRLGLTAEDHRRRFRACRLAAADRPFAWAWKLHDAAVRWLQPGSSEGETLPAETARWVRCHRPASLEVAVTLAEDHLAARAGEPGDSGRRPNRQAPVPAPRRRVPALGQAERAPALSPTNPFAAFVPSQGSDMSSAAPEPRRTAQMPGQECWKCGQPGHLRRDCPLMEVGQVFHVAGAPAPSPGPGGTYSIPISGSNHGSLTSTAPVANGIGRDHSQPNKDASSQASSSQSIHPAANESQDFSTPVTRAKTPSEPLPHCTESSAVSASPSATATTTPSVAAKESASALSSSGQDGNPAALPPQPGCSQSTSGASAAPQKVSVSKDEAKDLPQDKCATTGTEGHKDTKEQYQSKPSSSCNEKRSSRDRQRLYSSSGRDRERHNRDRSHERESDDDRHRYRRDYKEGNFSPSTAPETNKFKGSPPRARLSSPDKEDQNRKRTLSKDRDDSSDARHTKKHKKSKKKKKSKDKDRHRESGSSDGDSDRAAEMKKEKKRHRDSDPDLHSPDAARSHRNRSREEGESCKRHHSDRDFEHDNGFPPEKRRCTDYADGSVVHVNGNGSLRDYPTSSKPSGSAVGKPNHGLASSASSASISHSVSSEEGESRKRHHFDRDFERDSGFPPEKRRCTDYADGRGGHLLHSNQTTPANGSSYGHLNGQPGYSEISGSGFPSDLKH
ncbi:uncharacterized protein LOC112435315 [Maylandia zebra]|uniref:uncharacterized protein LOC112435315 n=1 Tax=Maylandia zebra TaxID=106582 RepID=UPI00403C0A35